MGKLRVALTVATSDLCDQGLASDIAEAERSITWPAPAMVALPRIVERLGTEGAVFVTVAGLRDGP